MFKIDRQKLRESHETPWLIVDLIMLGLLLINLIWLIFDQLYATSAFQGFLDWLSPGLVSAYQPIHDNFLLVDLAFIAIFLSEFIIRWVVAVRKQLYLRWYFFPFIHWYDLVGCIPLAATRIFRFLRIISILYRLHKYQIIRFEESAWFRFVRFYYEAFVEEISDRVVIKVLSDTQKDLANGSPLIDKINTQVIASRRPIITRWVSSVLTHIGGSMADDMQGEVFRDYVEKAVSKAVVKNEQVSQLSQLPLIGDTIEDQLEQAITDIVINSVINLLSDLHADKIEHFVEHGLAEFRSDDQALDQELIKVIDECLELVKAHVRQQRWKQDLLDDTRP